MKRLSMFLGSLAVIAVVAAAVFAAEMEHCAMMSGDKMEGCMMEGGEKAVCPMMIKGADVTVEKTGNGVVIKVTSGDNKVVAEIQKNADLMKECADSMKSGKKSEMQKHKGHEGMEKKKSAIDNKKADDPNEIVYCPVMGTKIKKGDAFDTTVYKGKTYYFCCGGCKPAFLQNPEKYVK